MKLTQPRQIDQVINDLPIYHESTKTKATPASSGEILGKYPKSKDLDKSFQQSYIKFQKKKKKKKKKKKNSINKQTSIFVQFFF